MAVKKRGSRRSGGPTDPSYPLQRLKEDPSLHRMAFYGGTRPEQQLALTELQKGLEQAGHPVMTFNCQKYARQDQIWPLMVQSLVLRLQDELEESDPLFNHSERLLENLDQLIDGELPQSRRVRLMERLDTQLAKLVPEQEGQTPSLVILLKGLGTLEPLNLVELVTFISGSLEVPGLTFVMGLREAAIATGLAEHYHGDSPLTPREFIEESFPVFFPLGPEERPRKVAPASPATESITFTPKPTAEPITFTPKPTAGPITFTPKPTATTGAVEPQAGPEELPELTDVRPRPTPTRLFKLYWDPMIQEKLKELQDRCPSYIEKLDRNPELLVILERLVRGDSEPQLHRELEVNPFLQTAYADVVLRGLLAQPPYFDPKPIDMDHRLGGGMGIRAMEGMESFEQAEPRGLAVENGSSVQNRRENSPPPLELEDLGPPEPPAPTARKVAARKVRKTGSGGTARKVRKVKKTVRRPVGHQEAPITFTAKVPAKENEVPRFRVPAETQDAPLEPFTEAVQAGDLNALKALIGQIPALEEELAEELAEQMLEQTKASSNRIKACATYLLGELRSYISPGLAEQVKDQLLVLTTSSQRGVREEAAAALAHYRSGSRSRAPGAAGPGAFSGGPVGGAGAPAFKPVGQSGPATFRPSNPAPPAGAFAVVDDDDDDQAVAVAAVAVEDYDDDDLMTVTPPGAGAAPAKFGVVNDKPKATSKAKAPTFGVVNDQNEDEKDLPTFGMVDENSKPKTKGGTFKVVE